MQQLVPFTDPRDEPIEIPMNKLSPEALEGLIEQYCTQFHGLNDCENPIENKGRVRKALENGDLGIYFDPVTDTTAIHSKETRHLR